MTVYKHRGGREGVGIPALLSKIEKGHKTFLLIRNEWPAALVSYRNILMGTVWCLIDSRELDGVLMYFGHEMMTG